MKDLSISLIKDYKHKTLTSQSIKLCKIITTCYEVTKPYIKFLPFPILEKKKKKKKKKKNF
jgi:hypothetical protein